MLDFNISPEKISPPTIDSTFFEIELGDSNHKINAQLDLHSESTTLVVAFHGSTKQSTTPYPVYQKKNLSKTLRSNVLSIADPTLQHDKSLSLGWYLGFHDFPAQQILVSFFRQCIELYNFEKIVFMGASGGGFAALFYSWHFPSSVALVANPQTILLSNDNDDLPRMNRLQSVIEKNFRGYHEKLCLSVCDLYKSGFSNYVIYLQNGECTLDVQHHAAPFLNASTSATPENVIMKIDYWGIKGHSGSVPFFEFLKWINAVNAVDEISTAELYSHYFEAKQNTKPEQLNKKNNGDRLLQISEMLGTMQNPS